jgi:probable O-glycosylation ligase (exosortase A-associated)
MRDLVLVAILLGLVPVILARPHVGMLAYAWLSLMNPHRLTFGFTYGQPFALAVFVLTVAAWLFSREPKLPRTHPLLWSIVVFAFWFSFTTLFAWAPEAAFGKWDRAIKMTVAVLFTAVLITDHRRWQQLVAVIAFSIAFFGVKGGIWTILEGGHFLVWGPPDSYIADNNALAVALVMVIPLLVQIGETASRRWLSLASFAAAGLTAIAVLGTHSRGGLLTLAVAGVLLWLRSRHRLLTGALLAVALGFGIAFMPESWFERMQTIEQYEEDRSLNMRFEAWAWGLGVAAQAPLTGGGFMVYTLNGIEHAGGRLSYLNAHSIYFEVLAEHGWPGLALFLGLIAGGILTARAIVRDSRDLPELDWAARFGALVQVSFVAYAVGGALLNLAFYDLFYYLLLATAVARLEVLRVREGRGSAATAPAAPVERAAAPTAGGALAGGLVDITGAPLDWGGGRRGRDAAPG